MSAFQAKRYRDAIDYFLQADAIVPSPALSFNTAVAYEKISGVSSALRHYRDYLYRAPDAENVAQVRRRIADLARQLAQRGLQQLTVRSSPAGAALAIDHRLVGVTPWTGDLAPGRYQIELSHGGFAEVVQKADLPAQEPIALEFVLNPVKSSTIAGQNQAPRSPSPVRDAKPSSSVGPWPFIALATGGAALLSAGTFELLRRSAESDAREQTTQIGYSEALETVESRRNTARVFAAVGGVLTVTGGVLLLVRSPASSSNSPSAALACGLRACAGVVRAEF